MKELLLDPLFIGTATLTVALGIAMVVSFVAADRRKASRARLAMIVPPAPKASIDDEAGSLRRDGDKKKGLGRHMLPTALARGLSSALEASGNRIRLYHLLLVAAPAAAGVFFLMTGPLGQSLALSVLATLAAAFLAPYWVVKRAQQSYQTKFLELFPDALDLIVRAVKAGLPALEAISGAANEIGEPVGGELRRVIDEMRIGVPMEDALQSAADRVRVPDFRFFVICLALQRRTGGGLAETLGNLSSIIRRRKELRVKARALTSESRTSAIVLGGLPLVVVGLLSFVARDYVSILLFDPRGRFILTLAGCSMLTGFYVMNTMIKRSLR